MAQSIKQAADAVLDYTTNRAGGVPGVVAMATDRKENFYEGAAGKRELGKDQPMTLDTVLALFSTTKALTGTCAMQLVEERKVKLDDAAKKYLPEIAELQVLEGFDAAGKPQTRPPKRDITINDLMLHTSGLCYEFFSSDELKYRTEKGIASVVSCTFASIRTVLLHDPGARWTYGPNIDWLGRIVEQQRGKRLGDVMRERVFAPLGMSDVGFTMSESMKARRATIHNRAADGKLTPLPELALPQPPEMDCGGHGLYGSVGEYMTFIRMLLNDGVGRNGRVLRAETVGQMAKNGLGEIKVGGWPTPSSGSTARMASAVTGDRRSCHSRTSLHIRASSTSKPRSIGRSRIEPPIYGTQRVAALRQTFRQAVLQLWPIPVRPAQCALSGTLRPHQ